MEQVSVLRPIARNIFYTHSARNLRPVSLDDILGMLVRYEGPNEPNDPDPKNTNKSSRTLLSNSNKNPVFISDVDFSANENTPPGATKLHT